MIWDAKFISDWVQWIVMIALSISVWLRKPGEDAGKAVSSLRADFSAHTAQANSRMATFDEALKHIPSREELAELEGTVKGIAVQVSGVAEGVKRQETQLNRISDFLLNGNRN
jgi:hypothetical protein